MLDQTTKDNLYRIPDKQYKILFNIINIKIVLKHRNKS